VTRGKRRVVIVGSYQQLEKAVKKKPTRRQTALGERVRKMLGVLITKKATEEKDLVAEKEDKCNSPEKKNTSHKADSLCFTPSKLSTMFEDSMRDWGSQEDALADVFKADSPGKRTSGGISGGLETVPKKSEQGWISPSSRNKKDPGDCVWRKVYGQSSFWTFVPSEPCVTFQLGVQPRVG